MQITDVRFQVFSEVRPWLSVKEISPFILLAYTTKINLVECHTATQVRKNMEHRYRTIQVHFVHCSIFGCIYFGLISWPDLFKKHNEGILTNNTIFHESFADGLTNLIIILIYIRNPFLHLNLFIKVEAFVDNVQLLSWCVASDKIYITCKYSATHTKYFLESEKIFQKQFRYSSLTLVIFNSS